MKALFRSSISRFFFSDFVASLSSVDIYFLFSAHILPLSFYHLLFVNTFLLLLYYQPLKYIAKHLASEIFLNQNFFSLSHFIFISPKSFIVSSNSIAIIAPWDFRRSCCLLSNHIIPLVLSMRLTTHYFHQWKWPAHIELITQ